MAEPWTLSAAGDVQERWEFLTDVLEPPTGEEQRRRLRIGPRIIEQFDGLESAARRRWMETVLIANGAGLWDVPLVQDATELDAAVIAGATSVDCDTTARRFVAGGRALLIVDDNRTFEVCVIESVAADSITFEDALALDWPAGARVIPLYEGRLSTIPSLERFTGDDVPVRLEFQLTEPVEIEEDVGPVTYRGIPVLELQDDWYADWSNAPTFTPERRLAMVDNETSIPAVYDQPGVPFSTQSLSLAIDGRPAIAALWSLLYALGGRWYPIWVPSQAMDLIVTSALTSAGTTIDVDRCGISDWPLRANRRDIRIQLASGTVLYRRITAATLLNETTERLTVDSAFGVNAAASAIELVSFLAGCRQDTDTNLLRYWRRDFLLVDLTFRAYLHEL